MEKSAPEGALALPVAYGTMDNQSRSDVRDSRAVLPVRIGAPLKEGMGWANIDHRSIRAMAGVMISRPLIVDRAGRTQCHARQ